MCCLTKWQWWPMMHLPCVLQPLWPVPWVVSIRATPQYQSTVSSTTMYFPVIPDPSFVRCLYATVGSRLRRIPCTQGTDTPLWPWYRLTSLPRRQTSNKLGGSSQIPLGHQTGQCCGRCTPTHCLGAVHGAYKEKQNMHNTNCFRRKRIMEVQPNE